MFQSLFRIIALQLVDRWRGYALKIKSKDAVCFFVILLFYDFGRLYFHLKHNGVKKKKKRTNLGKFLLAELCLTVVEVFKMGDVGNLSQPRNIFTVLARKLRLQKKGTQSKLCVFGHIPLML